MSRLCAIIVDWTADEHGRDEEVTCDKPSDYHFANGEQANVCAGCYAALLREEAVAPGEVVPYELPTPPKGTDP